MPTRAADPLTLLVALAAACSPAAEQPNNPNMPRPELSAASTPRSGTPVSFEWTDSHGAKLTSASLRGRVTVLAFITTYDVPSQAEMRFLSRLARNHAPRLNAVGVVLEPAENAPLVAAYADALDLKFPVVLGDAATTRGEGAFAGLHHVPAVAILDKEGYERFRHLGLMNQAELEAAVGDVESGK